MATNPQWLLKDYEKAKSARANWESYWDELSKYVFPERNNIYGQRISGERKGEELLDSTAINANAVRAAAMHTALTNPSVYWFGGTFGDETIDNRDDVRVPMAMNVKILHGILNNSNFQTEVHSNYLDEGSLGTSVLSVEEDDEDVVRFMAHPIYEYVCKENHKAVIDETYRCFKYTAHQILGKDEWLKNIPEELKDKMMNNDNVEYEIVHCIKPRKNGKRYGVAQLPTEYKFESSYVLKEGAILLEEGGYHELPLIVTRDSKQAGEVYGRSPAMRVLPDIRMIQKVKEITIKAAQLTIAPPFMVPDDGIMLPLKMVPLGVTLYRAGMREDAIRPLLKDIRVDVGHDEIERIKADIKEAYHADLFKLREGPQKTATEVMRLTEDEMRVLSPNLGRQQNEKLKPLIERVFNIAARKGLLVPFPKDVQNRPLKFVYSSQIAKAQRSSEIQNVNQAMSMISAIAQARPEALDNIDTDAYVRYAFTATSAPAELITTIAKRTEIRNGRIQAQQQQAKAQQEAQQAETLNKVAPAMQMME